MAARVDGLVAGDEHALAVAGGEGDQDAASDAER